MDEPTQKQIKDALTPEAQVDKYGDRQLIKKVRKEIRDRLLLTSEEIIWAEEDYIKQTYQQVKVSLQFPLQGYRKEQCLLQAQLDKVLNDPKVKQALELLEKKDNLCASCDNTANEGGRDEKICQLCG